MATQVTLFPFTGLARVLAGRRANEQRQQRRLGRFAL